MSALGSPAWADRAARPCNLIDTTNPQILALSSNSLVTINPSTLQVERTISHRFEPQGGVSIGPTAKVAYVTAPGPDGHSAIWTLPLADCGGKSTLAVRDAELPSVSPDGKYLGYVLLNRFGRQTGVAIVPIDPSGVGIGRTRQYPTSSVPPRLPIRGLAVAPNADSLAVWGGFVDPYLGPKQPTVGVLNPNSATSLSSLVAVFDDKGVSMTGGFMPGRQQKTQKPEDWQSAPVYLPNGELLVADPNGYVSMPFTNTTGSGGGMRTILSNAGHVSALAAGRNGDVAWITSNGTLKVERRAVDLPFGPQAEMPPSNPGKVQSGHGRYDFIAWTGGPGGGVTAVPPVFHYVAHLPSVVGMSQQAATQVMAQLALPVFVASRTADSSVPPGTVVAQDPPAGTGVACQCSIGLTIASAEPSSQ